MRGTDKGAGSVDREHNVYYEEFVAPDEERLKREREAMSQPPYVLDVLDGWWSAKRLSSCVGEKRGVFWLCTYAAITCTSSSPRIANRAG